MTRRVQRPAGPPPTRPIPCPPKQIPAAAKLLPRAVVFVGPMAVGKTSIGKRVAKALGVPFIDTDARIAQAHGAITEFFAQRGEPEFRRVEAEIVAREVSEPGARVVSLGGGAILTPETRALLANYPVILLMSTERAVLRTANLSRRPLLKDDPSAWTRILEERRTYYEEVADVTFRTDQYAKDALTRRVVSWIEDLPGMQREERDALAPEAHRGQKRGRGRRRRGRRGRRRSSTSRNDS
ncbi:MAG: shikimate kinase [Canibacter sp.]